jgi:hypothetical protein
MPTPVSDPAFVADTVGKLDDWVNALARPLLPLKAVPAGDRYIRLEFREQLPHAVMVGKLVRAVSGIRAAQLLSENG